MKDNTTFTTVKDSYPKVDLENLNQICLGLKAEFIQSFMGFPIKVDESLDGNQYYIAVSRGLLKEIQRNNANGKTRP